MKIYVDIDNTICKTNGTDYEGASPIKKNIDKINKLYTEGNEIHYWTARGSVSKINFYDLTNNQLNKSNTLNGNKKELKMYEGDAFRTNNLYECGYWPNELYDNISDKLDKTLFSSFSSKFISFSLKCCFKI